jgi:hypothetical protein
MPDRLSELVRQRALVLEHLAWLEREIAAAQAPPSAPLPPSPPAPLPGFPIPPVPVAAPAAALTAPPDATPSGHHLPGEPDAILEQYRVSPTAVKEDVRKGCFLYFVGAFVVVVIVIAILYFAIGSR